MKNKKIALVFLGDYRFDGRCYNMIMTLIKNKCYVDVYHHGNRVDCGNIQSDFLKEISINCSHQKIYKYLDWTNKIYNEIKIKKYDYVVASDLYSLFPVCLISQKNNIIYDSREIYTQLAAHHNSLIKKKILGFVEAYCIQKIKTIVTTAVSDTKYLKTIYNQATTIKYYTIYNFPLKTVFNKKTDYLKEKYKINNKQNILLYQGVVQSGRGIQKMINVVYKTKNNVGFIVGDGEYKKHYQNYVKKHALENKIYFINQVPYKQLLQITASANVGFALISPISISNKLALPNKLFEYAACGVPCLASLLPNMEKYIINYNLGLCVENAISKHIKAVNYLTEKTQQRFHFKNRLLNHLSWNKQEDLFMKLFTSK